MSVTRFADPIFRVRQGANFTRIAILARYLISAHFPREQPVRIDNIYYVLYVYINAGMSLY